MMSKNSNWTKEETIIAFNVYCKVPFRSSSKTNPTVIKYVNILGRSPSALNIPWAKDKNNRTNPRNGLCLNALHDKAFDKGLITITPDYKILVSDCFNRKEEPAIDYLFNEYNGKLINLPDRFLPSKEFLDYHLKHIFIK